MDEKKFAVLLTDTQEVKILECDPQEEMFEIARGAIGCDWIDLHSVHRCNLFPRAIRDNISGLIGHGETIFIGSEKDR